MANTLIPWRDVQAEAIRLARANSQKLGLSPEQAQQVEMAVLRWLGVPKSSSKSGKRKGC